MIISRKSWHYKVQASVFKEHNISHNLCLYFWKTILALVLLITLSPLFIAVLPAYILSNSNTCKRLYWFIFMGLCLAIFELSFTLCFYNCPTIINPWQAVGISFIGAAFVALIPIMLLYICFVVTAQESGLDEQSLGLGYASVALNKYCPTIEFKD